MSTSIRPRKELLFLLLAGTTSFFALVPDAKAVTTFQLTGSNESFSTKQLSVDGIILNLSSAVGSTLPSNPLNINGSGFCAYTYLTTSTRCGTSTPSSLQGFSLEFDKSVLLNQFNVSNVTGLAGGIITFTSGANVKQFNFSSTGGIQSFSNPFLASAGSTVFVTTSGIPVATQGIFRISDLEVQLAPEASVPGPLPLVGAGVAFAYSRKLRSRILRKAN